MVSGRFFQPIEATSSGAPGLARRPGAAKDLGKAARVEVQGEAANGGFIGVKQKVL